MADRHKFTKDDQRKSVASRKKNAAIAKAMRARLDSYRAIYAEFTREDALGILATLASNEELDADIRNRAAQSFARETRVDADSASIAETRTFNAYARMEEQDGGRDESRD